MAGHNNLPIAIGLAGQLYVFQSQMDWVVGPHHSVRISDSNVDNIVTLYRLRRASGRLVDDT